MQNYVQWSAVYASYFTIMGLWTAFGPATLLRLNPAAAPLALAAITLAYFAATPFAHAVFRRLGFGRAVVFLGGSVFACMVLAACVPAALVVGVPLAFFFGSGCYTLCETQMIEDLARQGRGHEFGRARKWGSAGFLLAAMAGGAVFSASSGVGSLSLALAGCAAAFALCCLALQRASHAPVPATAAVPVPPDLGNPAATDPLPTPGNAPPADTRAWARLGRVGATGCAAVALMRLAEAVSTTWFGAYWLHTGHGTLETGILCALPVAMEFLAMWKGGPLMARFSAPAVMLVCCLASALRWLATPVCSVLWCAVPLQSVHALTFGFFYPASLLWIRQQAGPHFFQVRYATEAAARAVTAAVTFAAAGWVIAHWGYGAVFGLASALACASAGWWWRLLAGGARPTPAADI